MKMTREDYALAALGLREVRDMTKTRAELIEAGREIAEAAMRDAKKRQGVLATLTKTYELLWRVEYKLSDDEARLLLDIAEGIELLEEKLNAKGEEHE